MKLVYDIGANIGKFTEVCLKKHPDIKVITVEPNKRLTEHLAYKFQTKSVEILDFLVSDRADTVVPFYESTTDTISTASTEWIQNSRFSHNSQWLSPVNKKTITIDKMISIYGVPDLVKIDVEGYELQVIKGLTKKINKICFEWAEEGKLSIVETCDYLEYLGYENFGYILGDEHLKEPSKWVNKKTLLELMDMKPERKTEWGMIWVR